MKLSLTRYRSTLLVQIGLLLVDLLINTFCEYLRFESVILLVVFIIQDVCLVFSLIIVFLSFFSTYVFQVKLSPEISGAIPFIGGQSIEISAGLVGVLFQQFRTPIFVSILYLGLSIAFHVWSLHVRWREPTSYWWTDGLQTLYVCQRFVSAIYYYYYKRTALRISDPKFYEDISWVQNEWKR